MPGSRKLGRTTDHRMSMLRGMVTYLFEEERIETTVTRAKEVRSLAEKMVTSAKNANKKSAEMQGNAELAASNPDLAYKRQVFSFITKEEVAHKLLDDIAPRYEERNGGYTRIIPIGPRRGDGAEMAIIELV